SVASPLVDAHVIDLHPLGEGRGFIRRPRPGSSDCNVQDDEERTVICPFLAGWQLSRSDRVVEMAVDIEADHIRFPLDRKNVELAREATVLDRVGRTDAGFAGVTRARNRAVDGHWLAADILHDVDLA